jgi:hypothetical protein
MKRILSQAIAFFLWVAFLYAAVVTIFIHFLPHFVSWKLDQQLVYFLLVDFVILQLLAWLYKKLPNKPNNIAFTWMEKVSLL